VQVFSGANVNNVLRSFFAFDPGFTAGVYVAAGDVNGDGQVDIITGAGEGDIPQVKVFNGADVSQVLQDFLAYAVGFTGGVRVGAIDRNGDGRADILTGAGPSGGPHFRSFDGLTLEQLDSFFAYEPDFTAGMFVG
jgi:serralysin